MTAQHKPAERLATLEEAVADMARSVTAKGGKGQAFDALRRIIRAIEDSRAFVDHADMSEASIDLARLYAHFLPAAPKRPKSPFDWVIKAMAKNDVRYYLNWVHVTADTIQGTDGHRLHSAPNTDGLEPGFYDLGGTRVHGPDYARFPDTHRVRPNPDSEGRTWHTVTVADLKMGSHATEKNRLFHWVELPTGDDESPHRVHIDKTYFDHVISMAPAESIQINTGGMGDSVLVEWNDGRWAVLMPLRQ